MYFNYISHYLEIKFYLQSSCVEWGEERWEQYQRVSASRGMQCSALHLL